jgi:tetrapyrrole methylase family protein/MazG family protein
MPKTHPRIPAREFRDFVRIVRRLRRDCPWDRRQTHRSLRTSLIEETYEVIESLDRNRVLDLRGELGDLLLHVALHASIAEQKGEFTFRQVIADINAKLIRRHPHVFGTATVKGAEEVKRNWEQIKLSEGRRSYLDGVPRHLPALQRALRLQQRAARVGFDWENPEDVWKKVREEVEEVRQTLRGAGIRAREEEFGDLLFALVNYARFLRVNPETALRRSTKKFTSRFQFIERQLRREGKDPRNSTLAEMDTLWNLAKKRKSRPHRRLASPNRRLASPNRRRRP